MPEGLSELLHDFTVSALTDRPSNLYEFAANYFMELQESKKDKPVPLYIVVNDDDECGEPDELR